MAELNYDDLRFVVDTQLQAAGFDTEGAPYGTNSDGEHWPLAQELRERIVQAVMADFGPEPQGSVPASD